MVKNYFRQIEPRKELSGFIRRIWIFNSDDKIPDQDIRLLVPADHIVLLIPFRNDIRGTFNGENRTIPQHTIAVIGVFDVPVVIDNPETAQSSMGTIGIEFNARSSYRFFDIRFRDITNRAISLDDIVGWQGKNLQEQVTQIHDATGKIDRIQRYLAHMLFRQDTDPIFEYCIQRVNDTSGRISVADLARETGYSSRWLNIKFDDHLGISPKRLISIYRFRQCYNHMLNDPHLDMDKMFYDHYYDQSHFIRQFKRFTGMTPGTWLKSRNDFGRSFYTN